VYLTHSERFTGTVATGACLLVSTVVSLQEAGKVKHVTTQYRLQKHAEKVKQIMRFGSLFDTVLEK
jgi:hypothetical protein